MDGSRALDSIGLVVLTSFWEACFAAGVCALVLGWLPARAIRWRSRILFSTLICVALWPLARLAGSAPAIRPAAGVAEWIDLWQVGRVLSGVLAILALAWLAGVGIGLLRVWHRLLANRRLARSTQPAPAALTGLVQELCLRLGCSPPEVRTIDGSGSPAVVGVLRPVLIVPAALRTLDAARLRTILAHEVAHVLRRDPVQALAQAVLEALAFHHPAARALGSALRRQREHRCDALAVAVCGSAEQHAQALLDLSELRLCGARPPALLATAGRDLRRRLEHILQGQPARVAGASRSLLIGLALWAVGAAGVVFGAPCARLAAGLASLEPTTWAEMYGDSLVRVLPGVVVDAQDRARPSGGEFAAGGGALIFARGGRFRVDGDTPCDGRRVNGLEEVSIRAGGETLWRLRLEPSAPGEPRLRIRSP